MVFVVVLESGVDIIVSATWVPRVERLHMLQNTSVSCSYNHPEFVATSAKIFGRNVLSVESTLHMLCDSNFFFNMRVVWPMNFNVGAALSSF